MQYLKGYYADKSEEIDRIWDKHNVDNNGYLDFDEVKLFMNEIQ